MMMMSSTIVRTGTLRLLWILLFALGEHEAFTFPSPALSRSQTGAASSSSSLVPSLSAFLVPELYRDENDYRYIFAKAKECAYSDTSSSTEAKEFLNRIFEMESLCVSGALAGRDLCDNVDEVADVVAHLRQRALHGPASLPDPNLATLGIMSILPASLLLLLLGLVIVSTYDWKTGAVPFTVEEWIWATRGGYLHSMIDHYIRNAGL